MSRLAMTRIAAVAVLLCPLAPVPADAEIPVDFYTTIALESEIPTTVRAGDEVRIAGVFLDTSLTRVTFGFAPDDESLEQVDLAFHALAGHRFERTVTFTPAQQGTYAVHVWSGRSGEASWPHRGVFDHFVVEGRRDQIEIPRGYFDGLRLDATLPLELPLARPLLVSGTVLDPQARVVRLDLTDVDTGISRALKLPREGDRFSGLLRLRPEEVGPLHVAMVTGLHDDTYWPRGAFQARVVDAPAPDLEVGVLRLSLRPGQEGLVPLTNRGDGDLQLGVPEVTGESFRVTSTLRGLAPGSQGGIRVAYDGSGGDSGTLTIVSDDPGRPRVRVALLGAAQVIAPSWTRLRPETDGRLRVEVDLDASEYVLALYSARVDSVTGDEIFGYTLGGPAPLAKRAPPSSSSVLGEAELRRREAVLARRVAQAGLPARRTAAVTYALGDRRTFVFDDFGPVPRQRIAATVVAISERAVAFAHDGTGAAGAQLPTAQIGAMLEQFDLDYGPTVAAFGAPVDVDGDGRIAFLYSPLVDSTGFGGFVNATSFLPESAGGNGNLTDLIYISLGQAEATYRSLLVHEFQHLINFDQHVLVRQGHSEVSWLNEGLSHLAEDLVDGYVTGGNADRAHTYLADPAAAGLSGDASHDAAKRGAAYLFVRSLADRYGPDVVLRLVQTGHAERDNLEAATGQPFEDLLAAFAAQLYLSGTEEAGHPDFGYDFERLAPAGGRGFPMPDAGLYDAAGTGLSGTIRARGLGYVRVHGGGRRQLDLVTDPAARIRALLLPVPRGFEPEVQLSSGYFRQVRLDGPLPAVLRTGQAFRVRGTLPVEVFPADAEQPEFHLEYQENPDAFPSVTAPLTADGHFDREFVFAHEEAGEYALSAFARWRRDGELQFDWLGRFRPVRVLPGSGVVQLPQRYFLQVLLDAPLAMRLAPGQTLPVAGTVLQDTARTIGFSLRPAAGDTLDLWLDVDEERRFAGALAFPEAPKGIYHLDVFLAGPSGSGAWIGGFEHFAVGDEPITAVTEEVRAVPQEAALLPSYPNPFNAATQIPFQLPREAHVRLEVYGVTGQRVAVLLDEVRPAGRHMLRWEGRTPEGDALASGVYLLRLRSSDRLRSNDGLRSDASVHTGRALLLR